LHDEVTAGRCLLAEAPLGRFTLPDGVSERLAPAAVLIAGGVGITPLMSVLRQLHATGSRLPVAFLAYFSTPDEIIFRDELRAIAKSMPMLTLQIIVEQPDADWTGPVGRPAKDLIAAAAGPHLMLARVHICGPRPMMDAVTAMLADLHVSAEQIRTEDFFTAAESAARDRAIRIVAEAAAPVEKFDIHFREHDRQVEAAPGLSLLDAALSKGVPIRHACGAGCCGECRLRIDRGTFETEDPHRVLTPQERRDGYVLACRTYPTSDIELAA
jgi:ferredoxin-NADP reductase